MLTPSLSTVIVTGCSLWNKCFHNGSFSVSDSWSNVDIKHTKTNKQTQQLFIVFLCKKHCCNVLQRKGKILRLLNLMSTRWHWSARLDYWEQISHPVIYHLFSGTKGQRSIHLHCSSPQILRDHRIYLERETNSWTKQHLG